MIEVRDLRKTYDYYEKEAGLKASLRGVFHRQKLQKEAVKDICFSVPDGQIVGFIGPNGAGKTTTLKMLSGILVPTAGFANVDGFTPWERKKAFKMNIAIVMGQKSQLNWDLPAEESFVLNRYIYEVDESDYRKRLAELCGALEVGRLTHVQVRRLSLGERMKMELIAALLHQPRTIFLDEPTIGLDVQAQRAIRDFIRRYNAEHHATILLTSHYMEDIASLCSRAMVINHGDLVYDGSLTGIRDRLSRSRTICLRFAAPVEQSEIENCLRDLDIAEMDAPEGGGVIRAFDGLTATVEVPAERIKDAARAMLDALPATDLTIDELPIEEAIAKLYQEAKA